MENVIGETVFHKKYKAGKIKYQQTRIGVQFNKEKHIITFDYPDDFKVCLVAKSKKLIEILSNKPNWFRCQYCELFYENYTDIEAHRNVCENCSKDLIQCGRCCKWFYKPKVIKHNTDSGLYICNHCYQRDFIKLNLHFPLSDAWLKECGYSSSEITTYISLFNEIHCIGIQDPFYKKQIRNSKTRKQNNIYIQRQALLKKPIKILFELIRARISANIDLSSIDKIVNFTCNSSAYMCSDLLKPIKTHIPNVERIMCLSGEMVLHSSVDRIRGLFEEKLVRTLIMAHDQNEIIARFYDSNSVQEYIFPENSNTMHFLSISDVKATHEEFEKKLYLASTRINSLTNILDCTQLAQQIESYIDELLRYKMYFNATRNLANAISSYNQMHPTDLKFNPANNILYFYKANCIKCKQRHNNQIISATAMIMAKSDERVPINVEYCTKCKKFFMAYSLFEMYRKKYKFLIVKLQKVTDNGEFPSNYGGGLYQADMSPLRLAGYSVSFAEGLSPTERHQLLANIIREGILPKYKVIDYLRYFISMNEDRNQMELAVQKWKEDLLFVLNYRLNEQPAQEIDYYSSF